MGALRRLRAELPVEEGPFESVHLLSAYSCSRLRSGVELGARSVEVAPGWSAPRRESRAARMESRRAVALGARASRRYDRFVSDEHRLDDLDRRILDRLKLNGREPAASIAKQVSLSAAAVQRRIDRLETRGIIKGFTVAINYDKLESSVDAYIELSFDGKADVTAALGELIKRPDVREAITIAGDPDALLRVRVRSPAELGRLAMELRKHELVLGTKTLVVIGRWWHGALPEHG